ncbi:hypothetical protein B0H16DRAFT_1465468 [Mycena metata]|uniref:Uncharacterized protein n=1 Tax=Mycena metata TaxID=1033252 RepID=A0AAD7IBD2_9AGAR|nr:hypothetical protein B0H16DRAFT_1465468 [Mycena metata]
MLLVKKFAYKFTHPIGGLHVHPLFPLLRLTLPQHNNNNVLIRNSSSSRVVGVQGEGARGLCALGYPWEHSIQRLDHAVYNFITITGEVQLIIKDYLKCRSICARRDKQFAEKVSVPTRLPIRKMRRITFSAAFTIDREFLSPPILIFEHELFHLFPRKMPLSANYNQLREQVVEMLRQARNFGERGLKAPLGVTKPTPLKDSPLPRAWFNHSTELVKYYYRCSGVPQISSDFNRLLAMISSSTPLVLCNRWQTYNRQAKRATTGGSGNHGRVVIHRPERIQSVNVYKCDRNAMEGLSADASVVSSWSYTGGHLTRNRRGKGGNPEQRARGESIWSA